MERTVLKIFHGLVERGSVGTAVTWRGKEIAEPAEHRARRFSRATVLLN